MRGKQFVLVQACETTFPNFVLFIIVYKCFVQCYAMLFSVINGIWLPLVKKGGELS